ncbi:sodium/potassium-transporting ATPase subunit beta-1-interacting protein 4 isoform X4 [Rattus norvegicus]|uniref:sodium/potassium-transporting ATPase subunit beta-1-interacting protein 4 isoform X4 n=1 Tax=Rattus norvegicus TaxID=10116 RepID=UPI002FD7A85B
MGSCSGRCTLLALCALQLDSELLTFSLSRHRSWWEEYGPDCLHEKAATAGLGALHGQSVVVGPGCGMVHSYVEALHSGLQILLALLGFVYGCYVVSVLTEEDDSCLHK